MLNWISVTRLADTVVMLPAAVLCLIWLMMGGASRLALWWCVLLSAGLILVAATKIAFLGWGIGISALDFTGISGHAMRATAIMPVLLYLVFINASWRWRVGAIKAGMVFGVLIGVSRLVVHVHSPTEVVAGCLLGAVVSSTFLRMMLRVPQPVLQPRKRYALPLLVLLLVPVFTAKPAPTERWMDAIAMTLSGHEKLYSRGHCRGQSGV
jgi:membrane-associated phospholipid phosphatase